MSESDARDSVKTCFVAMPITTPEAYVEKLGDPDHFAHVLDHLFTPALKGAGLTVIEPAVIGSEIIHAEIVKNLEQADFVLCDLSDLNPNVLFELGIRTSLDRPAILVKDNLTDKIPFDLNAISTATYDSSLTPWSLAVEVPRLTKLIQGVISSGNLGNPMWRYFGLTKRGVPSEAGANPVEAKLDLIIREMEKFQQVQPSVDLSRLAARLAPPPQAVSKSYPIGSKFKALIDSFFASREIDADEFEYEVRIIAGDPTLLIHIPLGTSISKSIEREVESVVARSEFGVKDVEFRPSV